MAVSYLCGFDMGSIAEGFVSGGTTPPTITTTGARTGYCCRLNYTGSGTNGYVSLKSRASGGTQRTFVYSVKLYLKIGTLPTLGVSGASGMPLLLSYLAGVGKYNVLNVTPGGALSVAGVASTNTLSADGLYHRIEVDCYSTGADLYVDGALWAHATQVPTLCDELRIGVAAGLFDGDYYLDDLVIYDATTSGQLSNDFAVNLLLPTADSSVGNWKRNDGTTGTSLFSATDNIPPTGTAVTSTLAANYVQNSVAGVGTSLDNLDLTCAAYTSVTGLTTASQVLAVMPLCNDAQQVTTGSPKSGAVAVASNPAVNDQSFDFGIPNGTAGSTTAAAQGTFPTGWGTHTGAVVEAPSLTMGSGPVVRVKRTGTYTRVLSVDFTGVYVMWAAASTPAAPPRPVQVSRQAATRSAFY